MAIYLVVDSAIGAGEVLVCDFWGLLVIWQIVLYDVRYINARVCV